jgi:hypothetical protein
MVKTLIVSLSFSGLGIVAYLAVLNLKAAVHSTGHTRRLSLAYATARVGFIIVVALITEAIFRIPVIPFSWRVVLYVIGLAFTTIGYLGIALEGRRT